jgi:hypothetical protein
LPEEDFTISYQIVNTGEKFPDHTEFCHVEGSSYFKSYTQKVVPSLAYGMATEIKVQLVAPSIPGSYECGYMIGYNNGASMQYIGDIAKLIVNVSGELTLLEKNAKLMHNMGYDKDAALAMLKLYNNNLNLALQYIENAAQNKII